MSTYQGIVLSFNKTNVTGTTLDEVSFIADVQTVVQKMLSTTAYDTRDEARAALQEAYSKKAVTFWVKYPNSNSFSKVRGRGVSFSDLLKNGSHVAITVKAGTSISLIAKIGDQEIASYNS